VFGTEISVFKNKPSYLHQDFGMMPWGLLKNQQKPTQHIPGCKTVNSFQKLFTFFFLWGWNCSLNSGLPGFTAWAITPVLLLSSFWSWGFDNYLPHLALNYDPPELSFTSAYDYRLEQQRPGSFRDFCVRRALRISAFPSYLGNHLPGIHFPTVSPLGTQRLLKLRLKWAQAVQYK
jgi:hypothetical protein